MSAPAGVPLSTPGAYRRLRKVRASAELVAQALTTGEAFDGLRIRSGLPPGAHLVAVDLELAPSGFGPDLVLLFEHETFDEVPLPRPTPLDERAFEDTYSLRRDIFARATDLVVVLERQELEPRLEAARAELLGLRLRADRAIRSVGAELDKILAELEGKP